MTTSSIVKGRVSFIVPCYNIETYLDDFIVSLVAQTYKDLEVILVNDGANRATTEKLRSAVPKLEKEGYLVKLIEQQNKGLGGACDAGLKHFTGEFLMWPDPDDWLAPGSTEIRVGLMRANPEVGLLRTNAKLWIESEGVFQGHFIPPENKPRLATDLFEELLVLRKYHAPVCHMVRSEMFLQVHPQRSIWFGPRSSQNFQLLVPFVERFPVLEIASEVLACYRVREDSRSRAPSKSREALISRFDQLFELADETMPKLQTATPERLERMRNFHWRNRMLPTAFRAAMNKRGRELIERSALSTVRKQVAWRLLALRCCTLFRVFDERSGLIASRILARLFDWMVVMPPAQVGWKTGPLWTEEDARVSVQLCQIANEETKATSS